MAEKDCVSNKCCEERHSAFEKLINIRFDAIKEIFKGKDDAVAMALVKAEEKLDVRLSNLNEYKEAAKEYITKTDHESLVKEVNDIKLYKVGRQEFDFQVREIEQLRLSKAELSGKATQESVDKVSVTANNAAWRGNLSLLISFLALLLAFAIHFWTK